MTRAALRDVLKEQGGWDVIHFSGHGLAAGLVLEKPDGTADLVKSEELLELLRPGRSRLKWVTLSACLSAARTVEETLRWLGLEPKLVSKDEATAGRSERELAAVARALVREPRLRRAGDALTRWATSSRSSWARSCTMGCSRTSCR